MSSLRNAITFLAAGRLTVNTAHRFVFPFLPAISRGLGVSLETTGLLLSARSIAFVATPVIVSTAGRGERRVRLAVVGLALMSAGAMVTAATGVVVGALAGFVLLGLGKPSFDAAAQAYVADRTPYSRRARYMSILELTWAGGLLVGAPAAGWLIATWGWRAPFWIISVVLLVAAIAAPRVMEPDETIDVSGAARLRPDRSMVTLLVVGFLFSFGAENTFVVFGAWLEDGFAFSLAALGVASTLIATAELSGEASVLAFADRIGPRRMVAMGLVASTAGYAALSATAGSLGWGLVALATTLVAFEISIVATVPLATEAAPLARSRFLAWLMVALGIGRALGDATGPALYAWKGMSAAALASAASSAVALWLLLARVVDP